MAEAEKLSYLGHPIQPDDVTIKFISARWPETEIIIYDKMPFQTIFPFLYNQIRKELL